MFSISNEIGEKHLNAIIKKKRKLNKAVLVARRKFNSIENKISRALKDKGNNPEEFMQQL